MAKLKNRRGVALVLTAFMLTALIGAAAIGVDFGRMYVIRADLHSASDAAALAGMFWASQSHAVGVSKIDARDTAYSYARRNSALGDTVHLLNDCTDIVPGRWTGTPRAFVQADNCDWDASTNDAVQVTTHYTGSYIFGRLFGFTTHTVAATSVAVRGSVGTSNCVRPFAIPYQAMLEKLTSKDGIVRDPLTYDLTKDDINTLSSMGVTDSLFLKVSSLANNQDSTAISPNGNYYAVDLPPVVHNGVIQTGQGTGAPPYEAAVRGCTGDPVSVNDWLAPENGAMIGPTNQAISNLCPPSGTCTPAYKIVAAIWDRAGTAVDANGNTVSGCGGKCFHVKYLGEFSILGYSNSVKSIYGYFNTMTTAGGFTDAPGPVQVIALVK